MVLLADYEAWMVKQEEAECMESGRLGAGRMTYGNGDCGSLDIPKISGHNSESFRNEALCLNFLLKTTIRGYACMDPGHENSALLT